MALDLEKKKIIKKIIRQGLKLVLNWIITAIAMFISIIIFNIFTKGLPAPISPNQSIISRILSEISW